MEWSKEDDEFLANFYPEKGWRFCASNLNKTEDQIFYRLKKLGIKKNSIFRIKINKDDLYQLYVIEGKTTTEIAKIYNCEYKTICRNLEKYDIKIRPSRSEQRLTYNKDYFSTPNSQNCYWAGFIGADGCIYYPKNSNVRLTIKLSSLDRDHLVKFQKDIEFIGKIQDTIVRKNGSNPKKDAYYYSIVSIFNATNIANDLNNWFNITPKKSLTLQPPNLIELEHKLAYIIGYIDGDGCITIKEDKRKISNKRFGIRLQIEGTLDLLNWINGIFENSGHIIQRGTEKAKYYRISFNGTKAMKILETLKVVIEKHDLPFLARKWNKIQEYKNLREN